MKVKERTLNYIKTSFIFLKAQNSTVNADEFLDGHDWSVISEQLNKSQQHVV